MSIAPPPSRENYPVQNGQANVPRTWIKWFSDLQAQVNSLITSVGNGVTATVANLTDIAIRKHSDLQDLNTSDYAHLYLADRDALVSGQNTTLHQHSRYMDVATYDVDADGVVDQAENVLIHCRNNTGATVTKGSAVYLTGAIGQRPTIALAKADAEATSSHTIGMVSADIANNADGYVIILGRLANVDTSAFSDGNMLWLSSSVAGGSTATRPAAPAHAVFLGVVAHAHNTQGVIVVNVQNGYELNELHNVLIAAPQNDEVLTYESATGLYKNKAQLVQSVGGFTGVVTASNLLSAVKTVDGAGSGLDADTVDGLQASAFSLAGHDHANEILYPATLTSERTGGLTIRNPTGAYFTFIGTPVTGAIKITIPQSWTSTMMSMRVRVFNYLVNSYFEVLLGGYNYSPTTMWINTSASIIGDPEAATDYTVRLGHDGTKCCIYIGELTSSWSHIKVEVLEFCAAHSNFSAAQWESGWTIGLEAVAFGTISGTHVKTQLGKYVDGNRVWDSGNLGTKAQFNTACSDGDFLFTTDYGHNASIAAQGSGFATDTYVTGSFVLFNDAITAKSIYRLKLYVSKTASGTATPIISVRIGTAGTTADSARATLTLAAQTAAADEGVIEVFVIFYTVGSGTTATVNATAELRHKTAAAGLSTEECSVRNATSAGFDSTVANLGIGVSINAGTSAAWTINGVSAELIRG